MFNPFRVVNDCLFQLLFIFNPFRVRENSPLFYFEDVILILKTVRD